MPKVRSSGPYVGLAVLCQRVDRQPDETTDIVGITDGCLLDSPFPDRVNPRTVHLTVLLRLYAGDLLGDFTLAVRSRYPSGADGPMLTRLVPFTPKLSTGTFLFPIEVQVDAVGIYWFDVLFERRLLTRVPFVVRRRAPTSRPTGEAPDVERP